MKGEGGQLAEGPRVFKVDRFNGVNVIITAGYIFVDITF